MGFAIKTPKMSSAASAPTYTEPPVVTETVQEDTVRGYDQMKSAKRGLLSTILSTRNNSSSLAPQTSGNTTLG